MYDVVKLFIPTVKADGSFGTKFLGMTLQLTFSYGSLFVMVYVVATAVRLAWPA